MPLNQLCKGRSTRHSRWCFGAAFAPWAHLAQTVAYMRKAGSLPSFSMRLCVLFSPLCLMCIPRGQVCHFEAPSLWANSNSRLDAAAALRRLRLTLPKAILALELGLAPSGFHSRLSAAKKQYSYRLSTASLVMPFEARRCWICGDLNLDAMQKAIDELSGKEMDYSAFSTGENDLDYHGPTVKTVDISLQVDGPDKILIRATSERFLYKMVRRLVGGLVEVGKGRLEASGLESADRRQIPTAPPEGLSLEEVMYPFTLKEDRM